MANRIALTIATISFSLAVVTAWASIAGAAEYHPPPGTAKGNAPSAARAKMTREQAPGGCVISHKISADGSIHRISRCTYGR